MAVKHIDTTHTIKSGKIVEAKKKTRKRKFKQK